MSAPAITVLMPVYNAAEYLRQAIESTLAQTFGGFELLIIDDGSSDGSDAIVRSFNDPRIRYVQFKVNRGLVAALNEGIGLALGRYIARMDADDVMLRDRLEKQFDFLERRPEFAAVGAFVDFINIEGEVTGTWDTDRHAPDEADIRRMMPATNCIAHPTVMMRTDVARRLRYAGKYEDWDLWLRMLSRGYRIAKIPEVLLKYRLHSGSYMGVSKATAIQELRLLRSRSFFLRREWSRLRFNGFNFRVAWAQVRTLARHLRLNVLPAFARDLYRVLTYSPLGLLRERRALHKALRTWNGRQVFLFPYLNMGGAEQVHVDVISSVKDERPLIIICGFSTDRAFEDRFAANGVLLELPRLLHHPWTRKAAHAAIARKINSLKDPSLFTSMTDTFFQVLPALKTGTRTYYLHHAFLFQPHANVQHKAWLRHYGKVTGYVFYSGAALKEFDKFLFAQNIPASRSAKLIASPAAVHAFGEVSDHERTGILFVGRDSPEKRLDLFLEITKELDRRAPGHFRHTVAGAEAREGHPNVSFMGIVRDASIMSALYKDNDLLLLTSTREGFPLVVMEAMAHGLVVLSTPVGDIPNRVDSTTGILTSGIDVPYVMKLVDAIIALDNDRDRMRMMKRAALAKARVEFSPEVFRQFYRTLLLGNA